MNDGIIAYLGPIGTYGHMGARQYFGEDADVLACPNIPAIFDAVAGGDAVQGVAPIENSTEGGVTFTMDCLLEHSLKISGELVVKCDQCLIGPQSELSEISVVKSHPQALAQCKNWLTKNLPSAELLPTASTSGAVLEVDDHTAAIASPLASSHAGVPILVHGVQDRPRNRTRFVVIGMTSPPRTGDDKTTLIFSTPPEQGALRRVLEVLDDAGINLTRIESRPHPTELWRYVFFTDLEGHSSESRVSMATDSLNKICTMVHVLGSYPRAPDPA